MLKMFKNIVVKREKKIQPKRNHFCTVRLAPEEKMILDDLAIRTGNSRSSVIRKIFTDFCDECDISIEVNDNDSSENIPTTI